jgi:hypothetical protein
MTDFHYLTGMYGNNLRDETMFVVTDGKRDYDALGVRQLVHEENSKKIGRLFDDCYYVI